MALYRETATGFIGEWATDPGVGFVAIAAQPTDTINNKVSWWRNIDTFGQTSDWHPSLPGTPEYPGSDTRAGNGVNILPSDYASFEWAGSLPPMYLANCIANRSTAAKFHGTYGVRYAVTLAGGVAIFAKDSSTYNIPINPNGKWIISAYVRPVDNAVRSVSLQLTTTAGNTYTVSGNTLGNNASWVRISGIFNLSADASVAARLAISQGAAGVYVDIDALMLEEKVGPLDNPSTFNSPWGTGISTEQFPDYGIPATKLYQDLNARIDLIDGGPGLTGSVNARIKVETDARTSADSAMASSITTLQTNVGANTAAIQNESTVRASADSAMATDISTVQTKVGENTASIQTQATAINGLQAQYSVKLDVNGYVAGFGLWNNGAGDSGFLVRADKFAVGMPGNTNKIPFYVDASGTYIYDAFIKNLTADKITGGTIGAQTINMAGATSIIKSSNYSAGVSGWQIKGDGSAEFQNVTIRGTLNAADLKGGYLSIDRLQDGSISNIKIGSVSADKITAGTIDANNITVTNLNASNIKAGTLSVDRLAVGGIDATKLAAGSFSGSIQNIINSLNWFGNDYQQIFSSLQLPSSTVSRQAVVINANLRLFNSDGLSGFYIDDAGNYIKDPANAVSRSPMNCTFELRKNGATVYIMYHDLLAFNKSSAVHLQYIDTVGGTNTDSYSLHASCTNYGGYGNLHVAYGGTFNLIEFKR